MTSDNISTVVFTKSGPMHGHTKLCFFELFVHGAFIPISTKGTSYQNSLPSLKMQTRYFLFNNLISDAAAGEFSCKEIMTACSFISFSATYCHNKTSHMLLAEVNRPEITFSCLKNYIWSQKQHSAGKIWLPKPNKPHSTFHSKRKLPMLVGDDKLIRFPLVALGSDWVDTYATQGIDPLQAVVLCTAPSILTAPDRRCWVKGITDC